jgi:hypothetical protein
MISLGRFYRGNNSTMNKIFVTTFLILCMIIMLLLISQNSQLTEETEPMQILKNLHASSHSSVNGTAFAFLALGVQANQMNCVGKNSIKLMTSYTGLMNTIRRGNRKLG